MKEKNNTIEDVDAGEEKDVEDIKMDKEEAKKETQIITRMVHHLQEAEEKVKEEDVVIKDQTKGGMTNLKLNVIIVIGWVIMHRIVLIIMKNGSFLLMITKKLKNPLCY